MAEHQELSEAELLRAQMQMEEIAGELAQCREDERSSKMQIFQILAAMATFLTVVTAVLSYITADEKSWKVDPMIHVLLYGVSVCVVCAAMTYIANLGLLSTFRHHYMVDLERSLDTLRPKGPIVPQLHWESVSKPLITLNPKHISGGLFRLFSVNAVLSFLSILALAGVYMWMQIVLDNPPEFRSIDLVLFFVCCVVMGIVAITLLVSLTKSEELYRRAKKKAATRRFDGEKGASYRRVIAYFIYPRSKDVQKVVFLLLGFLLGELLAHGGDFGGVSLWDEVVKLLKTVLVVDILVYQARYQWNDLRGMKEDMAHKEAGKRCRLPVDRLGAETAARISTLTLWLRLAAAAVFLFVAGDELRLPLGVCGALVLALGAAYETARTYGKCKMVLFLVCLGYPLRLWAGLWAAFPELFARLEIGSGDWCICVLVLLATAAFGEVFVSMTWVLEAVHLRQEGRPVKKSHLVYLLGQIDQRTQEERHPLRTVSAWSKLWNLCCLIMSALLFFAMLVAARSTHIIGTAFVVLAVAVAAVFEKDTGNGQAARGAFILLSCSGIFACGVGLRAGDILLFYFLEAVAVIYLSIYFSFRSSNYNELYSALDHVWSSLKGAMTAAWSVVLVGFFGKGTLEVLQPKKREL